MTSVLVLVGRSPGIPEQLHIGSPLGFASQAVAKERALFAWSLGNVQGQVHFGEDLQIC